MKKRRWFMPVWVIVVLFGACASTLNEDDRLSEQGFQELSVRNYREAERLLEEALSLNSENPYALLNMGVVYQNTGRIEKAREMYEKVIALAPEDTVAVSNKSSAIGKTLADLARENLIILEKQKTKAEVAAQELVREPVSAPLQEELPSEPEEQFSAVSETAMLEGEETVPIEPPQAAEQLEEASISEVKEGYYVTQKGDSLSIIAEYSEVYGDSLKWPSLLRLNIHEFDESEISKDFQNKELAEGRELKFVTPREAEENLTKLGRKRWAVNVLSVQRPASIPLYVFRLARNGFHTYITEAEVNGKEWTRLRVGFFEDHEEARRNAEMIGSLLSTTVEPMAVKISDPELDRFGGY
jgi:tetratricopeptide (TPR) repeat protein